MKKRNSYMQRAIELGELGRGKTSPNPFVGCVIVKNDEIIGEGCTQPWGKDHAEVQALKQAGANATGADIYVTLEPCAHYGKTPPCAKAIIEAGIKRVYAGIKDPNPKVNGKGFAMLEDAGIEVEHNIFSEEITKQLEYYLTYITKKRPFVFMKNAVTLDGKISDSKGKSKWITSDLSREKVHHLRNEVDAIITGATTVNKDDAMLNVRLDNVEIDNPIRVVVDINFDVKLTKKLVKSAHEIKTILYTIAYFRKSLKHLKMLELGVDVRFLESTNKSFDLSHILNDLYNDNIYSVMVEAGTKLSSSFLEQRLIDKIYYFIAPSILGGKKTVFNKVGVPTIDDKILLDLDSIEQLGKDILLAYYVTN